MPKVEAPVYAEVFAGCGGMSLGLQKAGWKGLFAIEKDSMAFETLKHNLIDNENHFSQWPEWLPVAPHDINDVIRFHREEVEKLKGTIDLVVGGPPCQGFSVAGQRDESDQRNKLVDTYIKFIKLIEPEALFFENVVGFTHKFMKNSKNGRIYSDDVTRKLELRGYDIGSKVIDFSRFGVPQERKRFILVGVKDADSEKFFENLEDKKGGFLKEKSLSKNGTSLWDAISDLEKNNGTMESRELNRFKEGLYSKPRSAYQKLMRNGYDKEYPDSHCFRNHKEMTIKKFQYILDNCEKNRNIDNKTREKFRMKKRNVRPLDQSVPSPTLTTLPDDYIHYSEPRVLTVREYARIQSFDDWYEFRGKYTTGGELRKQEVPRYSQVGNAIPPLFGEQAGIALLGI